MASATAQRRARLVEVCSAHPEVTVEEGGEGHLAFRVRKKTFGYYLFNHHGDGKVAFCCKSSLPDQRRLVREDPETFFVPAYVGAKGWVALRLDLQEVDWDVVSELARSAYLGVAPSRLAALVD
jgi:phosphoribosylglycinamide formyltransferase-1